MTFMVAMAQACDSSTRRLARAAMGFYAGPEAAAAISPPRAERWLLRARRIVVLVVATLLPLGLPAVATQKQLGIFTWQRLLLALIGISVVLVGFAASTRRLEL